MADDFVGMYVRSTCDMISLPSHLVVEDDLDASLPQRRFHEIYYSDSRFVLSSSFRRPHPSVLPIVRNWCLQVVLTARVVAWAKKRTQLGLPRQGLGV